MTNNIKSCSAKTLYWSLLNAVTQEQKVVIIFHICSDNEMVTLILGVHL